MGSNPEKYPTLAGVLKQDERLTVLYSPFRNRELNPEHYDEKIKFWTKLIEEYLVTEGKLTFSIAQLQNGFRTSNGKRPGCLQHVLNHMLKEGLIVLVNDWLSNINCGSTWLSWSFQSTKKIFSTLLTYSPIPVTYTKTEIESDTEFVYLAQLNNLEEKVLKMNSLSDRILKMDEWKQEVSTLVPNQDDICLLSKYLMSKGQIATERVGHDDIIKMSSNTNLPAKRVEISTAEKSQFNIQQNTAFIEAKLAGLIEKQEKCETLARKAIKDGKRSLAKHHLRSKKIAERKSIKLNEVLDNLHGISEQIESAESDARVIAAYESGKNALTKQLKDNNLTTDRVAETMLDLQEVLESHDEVSTSLGQSFTTDEAVDLEEELDQLLEEDRNGRPVSMRVPSSISDIPMSNEPDDLDDALLQLDDIDMEELPPIPSSVFSKAAVVNKSLKPGRNLACEAIPE